MRPYLSLILYGPVLPNAVTVQIPAAAERIVEIRLGVYAAHITLLVHFCALATQIGLDHLLVRNLVALSYEPEAEAEQPEPDQKAGDGGAAEEKLEEQAVATRTGEDRPGRE